MTVDNLLQGEGQGLGNDGQLAKVDDQRHDEGQNVGNDGQLVPCPSNHCRGEIMPPLTGNIGKCSVAGCVERVNLCIAKKVLTRHIQVKKGLILKVNMEGIDASFGEGVATMYLDDTLSLSDKFLELVNPHIMYDKKTMTLVSAESNN